jgi:hypothetical protein
MQHYFIELPRLRPRKRLSACLSLLAEGQPHRSCYWVAESCRLADIKQEFVPVGRCAVHFDLLQEIKSTTRVQSSPSLMQP